MQILKLLKKRKNKTDQEGQEEPELKKIRWYQEKQYQLIFGLLLVSISIVFLFSFYDYTVNWKDYQSEVFFSWDNYLFNKDISLPNGTFTTKIAHYLIFNQIGITIFLIPILLLLIGLNKFLGEKLVSIKPIFKKMFFFLLWLPVTLAFVFKSTPPILGGRVGYLVSEKLTHLIGSFGTLILLLFFIITFLILGLNWNLSKISLLNLKTFLSNSSNTVKSTIAKFKTEKEEVATEIKTTDSEIAQEDSIKKEILPKTKTTKPVSEIKEEISNPIISPKTTNSLTDKKDNPFVNDLIKPEKSQENNTSKEEIIFDFKEDNKVSEKPVNKSEVKVIDDLEIIIPEKEEVVIPIKPLQKEEEDKPNFLEDTEALAQGLVDKYGEFDPKLELGNFQIPPLDLMKDYANSGVEINEEELRANKQKIVETLSNYKIEISSIKATVGPTVTLYEIVPAPGVRISKIKGLENDIALSLAALGIRIIAPLPGRGTIGIEVPTKNPSIVSMKSVLMSEKFQNAKMELPVALGKTISNETFVADLAKMPHLLMAGATGQGKSVGLNAILTSLLYKKHPAELKFVLVDPKKVELTLFNHIERHYLAKLPGDGEAIITENKLVINTVNSLCIEMDTRYELLKQAHCRNLKEYNVKFKKRKLNPDKGHKFLPYIVLVIDEFADLIMTAGKEIEMPIARLAQLARAVGIHLIVATQRPTTNIITGTIKANFPARIAFRVTSNTDSRTILDSSGANQLIGRGDMLFTNGNDLTRIQCAFVDTPEVEKLCEYVGSQRGYTSAFLLPEYVGEDGEASGSLDVDLDDRDDKYEDAARVVVLHQQGSTSLIQRKLKLGYNRAGRIMDQLEATGVVGPFAGSKARDVLIPDEYALEQFLNELNGNK